MGDCLLLVSGFDTGRTCASCRRRVATNCPSSRNSSAVSVGPDEARDLGPVQVVEDERRRHLGPWRLAHSFFRSLAAGRDPSAGPSCKYPRQIDEVLAVVVLHVGARQDVAPHMRASGTAFLLEHDEQCLTARRSGIGELGFEIADVEREERVRIARLGGAQRAAAGDDQATRKMTIEQNCVRYRTSSLVLLRRRTDPRTRAPASFPAFST